jgi:hypothetical protein
MDTMRAGGVGGGGGGDGLHARNAMIGRYEIPAKNEVNARKLGNGMLGKNALTTAA